MWLIILRVLFGLKICPVKNTIIKQKRVVKIHLSLLEKAKLEGEISGRKNKISHKFLGRKT